MAKSPSTTKKATPATKKKAGSAKSAKTAEPVKVEKTTVPETETKVQKNTAKPESPKDVVQPAKKTDAAKNPADPPKKKPSIALPLIFGGVMAAALGAGAAYYVLPKTPDTSAVVADYSGQLAAMSETINRLNSRLANVEALEIPSDPTDQIQYLTVAIDTVSSENAQALSDLAEILSRLEALEKRPLTDATSQEAIAAYDRELSLMKDTLAEQRKALEDLAQKASAEVAAARAEAMALRDEAVQVAEESIAKSSRNRILNAIDNGVGFADVLAELQQSGSKTEIPSILSDNALGVISVAELQATFDASARSALRVARAEDPEQGNSVSSFLKSQLGVRSLSPQEGNSPDAILSRAQAAVDAANFEGALREISALSATAQDALSGWTQNAQLRLDVLRAAQSLTIQLNDN